MQVVILMLGAPNIEEGSNLEKTLITLSDDSNWRSALALFKDPASLKSAMKALSAKVAEGGDKKPSTDFQAAIMTVKDFWEPRDEFMQVRHAPATLTQAFLTARCLNTRHTPNEMARGAYIHLAYCAP